MIPQEKIEQAAKEYGDKSADQDINITLSDLREYAATDFTAGVRFAESEMGKIAQEFAELLYTWESKLELLNVSIANLSEAADPNTMTTFTVLQYQQMQLTQCIEGLRPIIAKFMEEHNNPAPDIEG